MQQKQRKKKFMKDRLRTAMSLSNYNHFANKAALGNVMEEVDPGAGYQREGKADRS